MRTINITVLLIIFAFLNMKGQQLPQNETSLPEVHKFSNEVEITEDITIATYFQFMDSLVSIGDSLLNYPISEHILVHHNSWIIDTLANTDYYRKVEQDSFVYDQRKQIVLAKGAILRIPDSTTTCNILKDFEQLKIEVNIPEYRLRIFKDSLVLYSFPIRVGQNKERFLKMAGRVSDLKTKHGKGRIIKHVKNPDFFNPVDGKQFYVTKRDDGKTTRMPQIPWIETEINGIRNGQMIHPTTNPKTLEKSYSNGCIGTSEEDAWRIYYHAPLGTILEIKYNLVGDNGKILEDIYGYKR
ncbi:L,D-transpeptidase [Aurantibacter crassamenti]|uniref:L,D-transpeptidase n=1 Tax=Aurantibacter crassamenti TaxID=1837375 RepID=UPI00193A2CDA|nr:L,D-transpeptidase [Aurantibacter crassamenti]MBM1106556.1 L,D-transpeptidase [Aurantibacter crassamenti]